MAARKKSSGSKSSSKKSAAKKRPAQSNAGRNGGRGPDAIGLLRADHRKVEELLEQFEKARGEGRKGEIAGQICMELTIHAQVEEEIFYPAAREALGSDEELFDEATVEHASAKDLIAQIEASSPGEELFEAKVKVLGEYVKHHVKEEQNELFPKVKKTKLDLKELGERIEARKLELEESGGTPRGGTRGSAGGLSGSRRGERATAKSTRGRQDEGIIASVARGMGFGGR